MKPQLLKGNNSGFWIKKISRNINRDVEDNRELLGMGWTVIRFWGKEIKGDVDACVKVIDEIVFEKKIGNV